MTWFLHQVVYFSAAEFRRRNQPETSDAVASRILVRAPVLRNEVAPKKVSEGRISEPTRISEGNLFRREIHRGEL